MTSRLWRSLLCAALPALAVGCVDRRFVVAANVPAAQVSVDGHPVGPAPVDGRYEYAGYYQFMATAPGYETLVQREKFQPKWYDYPGLDFFAEVVWPFRIEDVRYVNLELQPARPVSNLELQDAGDKIRKRAQEEVPSPRIPNDDPTVAHPPQNGPPKEFVPTPPPPRILPYQPINTYTRP